MTPTPGETILAQQQEIEVLRARTPTPTPTPTGQRLALMDRAIASWLDQQRRHGPGRCPVCDCRTRHTDTIKNELHDPGCPWWKLVVEYHRRVVFGASAPATPREARIRKMQSERCPGSAVTPKFDGRRGPCHICGRDVGIIGNENAVRRIAQHKHPDHM